MILKITIIIVIIFIGILLQILLHFIVVNRVLVNVRDDTENSVVCVFEYFLCQVRLTGPFEQHHLIIVNNNNNGYF